MPLAESVAFEPNLNEAFDRVDVAFTSATQTELVFVDRNIEGGTELALQLQHNSSRSFELHFLEADESGLKRITNVLAGRQDVTAIHLVSHGDEGRLQLGNATLTVDSMSTTYANEMRAIQRSLSSNSDILIYGCNFGRGAEGQAAAQQLSELTGADVAASNDLTGSQTLSADWDLEVEIGSVEATAFRIASFSSTLAIEATDGIVTVQDAENSAAGTVSLTNNGAPTTVTTSGAPFRVGQMLERIWQYSETGDVGESSFVFDINGIAGISATTSGEFGIIVSDQADLSGANTVTWVASGYDASNGLVYFHGLDLQPGEYFGLATKVEPDNFSVFPTASGLEDTAIDLGLTLNPAITSGGTLRDIIDTGIGFRSSTAGTTTTDFLIPAGTTGIKITGYSTRDIGTATRDDANDDYQSLNVSIDLSAETSNGFIAHLIDQGPSRSDQFAWTDAPLGTAVLSGGATVTGDADDNINPTFAVEDGVLKITENHQLQTSYHVEFLTNATSSAEFIQSSSAVREDGDQASVSLAIPGAANFLIISIADAATSTDSQVEYKGNSRIYVDLDTLTASGTVAAQRGETDNRVVSYAFEDYGVSSAAVGSVLSNATVVGDTAQTFGLLNDSQIYVDGGGNLVIDREDTFANNFNSLITVEYYERRDVGSSAEKLGDAAAYGLWNSDPSDPTSVLNFDIPANAQLGILNLSMNGTRTSDTNENMGAGFAVIDLVNGTSSGTMYMVRTGNIVDFVAWDTTDFGTVFFEDPNSISNHTTINQFNDKFAGNAVFNLVNGGSTLELSTHSNGGTQTFLDYFASGQIEWFGSAPFELTGFPIGGSFSQGSLNTSTGNWELTIQEALANGLFFIPDEHVSGATPVDVSIIIGDEVDTTQVRIEAVIDPISFDVVYACDDEDTDIDISGLVTPTFVDQDGSETITGISLSVVPIGHTISDGTNTFVSSAGSQSVNITGWNHANLIYRANPDESGIYTITMDVDWQDVGGGVTDTDSMTTTFEVEAKPVNDPPVAVDDFHSVLGNTTLNIDAANGILNNDSDIELDTLTAAGPLSGPSNGALTLNADGSFDYTPTNGFFGTDSFTYEVSDGNGGTDTATVYIDVSPPVIGPLDAIDDFETTDEETLINIVVMSNDDLPTSGAFNIQSTTPPSNGVITVLPDGTIDYTPNTDFFGTDTFTYTLADASGRTDTATVTVTVNNTQDPPVANADSGSTPEDTPLLNINILGNDSDPDGDPLTVDTATAPNGSVAINPDGTINYTPNLNFTGTDIVTYTISDGNGGTDTSTVLINIVPVADPPTSADHTVCFDEDTEYVFTAADFAFADGDPGDMLTTVRIESLPVDGNLTLSGNSVTVGQVISLADIAASRLVFRPAADGFGATYATFDFSVSDGALFQVVPNTMTLCVNNVQDPPVATDNAITVTEESTGTPLGLATPTDVDGDALTVTVTGLPSVGSVFLADGTTLVTNGMTLSVAQLTGLLYDAPIDYISGDPGDFTYDVTDGIDTDSGVVDITITPINDAPFVDLNGPAAGEDYKATFTEGGASIGIVDPSFDILDVDNANLQSMTITVGGVVDGVDEIVSIGGTDFVLTTNSTQTVSVGGVSFQVVYNAGTGVFGVTESSGGGIPLAAAETLLLATTYRNESPLPTTTDRTFDISITDPVGASSNAPTSTMCVERDSQVAAWTLAGPATVIDGNVANNTLSLSAALRDGETASVDLAFADVDTNSSDYVSFALAMPAAVAAYAGPGALVWDGTTLTFTSDGTGAMTPLSIPTTTTPDGVYEGDEDYTLTLSNPASATGETISIAAGAVTTTIIDNDLPPTVMIDDASELEGNPLEFTISLDVASFEDITLDLGLTNGSATVGTDVEATNFEYWDGTAWQPATNGTEVTIPAGATSLLVRIDSVQDGLVEPDETFTLGASVLAGTVTSASDTGTGQIINDDVGTIAIDDVVVDEDNGTLVFTVSLDQPSASTVTVNYATSSDTATSGVDFTAATGTVTFAPGSQSETIAVNITNDSLFEQSESFDINLSAASGATIGDALGVGTIIDDGSGPNGTDDDRPVISVNDVSATEDVDTHAVFTVSLSNPSTENIVLSLAVADVTATSGTDYGPGLEFFDGATWQPVTGNVTISAGATSLQVRTLILDDAIIDDGETYSLTATNVSGTTFNASDTGIGTIIDDPTPDITIVEITGPPSVTEGDLATYTVAINNTPITDVTVTFTYSGTASGGTDYSGIASVTIPAGSTSVNFDIATIDDTLGEPLENFIVTIDTITGGSLEATAISATDNAVTTNIIDDDVPTIAINDVVVTEGSDDFAEFTVELSNPTFEDIDFDLIASSVTAIDGSDFGSVVLADLEVFDGTNWIPATATTVVAGEITIRLRTPIIDDAILEGDEDFIVTATVTGGTTLNPSTTGTGTIQDDTIAPETVLVSLAGPATVVEGNTTSNYTLTLEEVPVEDVTVTLVYSGTAADGSDFTGVATVLIPTGSATGTFTLPTVNDSLYEISEDIIVTIDSVTGGGFEGIGIDTTADEVTTTITDVADIPTLSVNNVTAVEGTDAFAVYTIELSNLSVEDIDFDLSLADITALGGGTDYGSGGAGNLEVFDGTSWVDATSATIAAGTFSIQARTPIIDDTIDEPDETYSLTVDRTGGTTTNAQAVGTGTIIDNDAAPNITIDDANAVEGDPLVFNVTLSNPSSQPIVLDLLPTDVTATTGTDYSGTFEYSTNGGTTWILATSGSQVTVPALSTAIQVRTATTEDTTLESTETMTLSIASVLSGTAGNTSDTATGTITDDDTALVSITANDPVAGEPADNAQFTVSMTNPTDSPTVIAYTVSGSATSGVDYTALSGTITLPIGATSGLIDLTVLDDAIIEGLEDVTITLASNTSGDAQVAIDPANDEATATITDDDEATWQLTGATTVNEGASAIYNVDLLGELQSGESVSIDLSLTDNTTTMADYADFNTAVSAAVAAYSGPGSLSFVGSTLTFTSNGTGAMGQLPIQLIATNDAIVEGQEDYDVSISAAASTTGAAINIDIVNNTVNTTIEDTIDAVGTSNDTASWSIVGPAAADEGATAQYTVSLDAALGANETATVDISLTDIDTTSTDYTSFINAVSTAAGANPNVTFVAGTLTYTAPADGATMTDLVINLGINNDTIIEGPQDFRLDLATPGSSTGAVIAVDPLAADVTTTINDTQGVGGAPDGPAEWSITGDTSADEGGTAQYTVSLSGLFGSDEVVTVDLGLTDIDTSNTDYASIVTAITTAANANPNVVFSAATGTLTYTAPSDGASMSDLVIDLGIVNDTIIEGPEDYSLDLSNATTSTAANVAIDATAQTVTTTIDDTQGVSGAPDGPAEWSIAGPTSADEGATAQYTVALSGQFGAGEVVTVDLGLTDVDTNSSDYANLITAITTAAATNPNVSFNAATGTLTYTAPSDGATMIALVIDLGITDDSLIEGPQDFTLALTNATTSTGANVGIDVTADHVTTTINDTQGIGGAPDGPAEWSITGSIVADEGDTAEYTIELTGQFGAGAEATIEVDLTELTTFGTDHSALTAALTTAASANPEVAFNAATSTLTYVAPSDGSAMTPLTVEISITDDVLIEGPEQYNISLSNPGSTNGVNIGLSATQNDVTTEINDTQGVGAAADGPAEWSIIGTVAVDEGDSAQYTVALSGQFGIGEIVTVDLGLTNIDTNSSDYASIVTAISDAVASDPDITFSAATGTLTYTSPSEGASMSAFGIDLGIVDDILIEGPQDYSLVLTNPTTSTGANVGVDILAELVTTTINDTQGIGGAADGPAEWSITGATSVDEGGTAQYTVALTGVFGAGEVVTVDLGLTDISTNSSDYANISAAITAAAVANANVSFNAATGTMTYTAPVDGATMTDLVVNLGITDDTIVEGPEDYSLTLSNAATSSGANVAIDAAAQTVTTTINDTQGIGGLPDGPAEWSITGPANADEGATAQYTVALAGQFGEGEVVTVDLGLTDIDTTSPDYASILATITATALANPDVAFNSATGTLTYTSPSDGASMADLVIDLGIVDDVLIEGPEDFSLALTNATTSSGANVAIDATADDVTTTINDTQGIGGAADGPAEWSITGVSSADEGSTAQYTVALSGQFGVGEVVSVDLGLTDIDTNGSDYAILSTAIAAAAAANPDVTFNAASGTLTYTAPADGATMTNLVIDLGITDDVLIEGPEDYALALSNPATSSGAAVAVDLTAQSVTTTINDTQGIGGAADGPAEWSITGPATSDEGATAQYTVSLSGQFGAGEVVTVDLGLTDIDTTNTDYASIVAAITAAAAANPDVTFNAATGTLTYTAPSDGASMTDLVINLGITDDVLIEGPEDYSFVLTNSTTASGANVTIDPAADDVTTTINDTQGPGGAADGPATWSITGTTSVDEGSTAQYTIALSGQFGGGEVVTVDLGLTDIDTNSTDYASIVAAITAAAAGNLDVTFNAATGTLTYTAPSDGASMTDLVIDLGITDDVLIEGPEDYTLVLTDPATSSGANVAIDPAADDVVTTINDTQGPGGAADGPAEWSITGQTSVDEGGTAQYTVVLSGQFGAGEVVVVDLALTDIDTNSTDYASIVAAITTAAASNPNVTFVAGTLTYTAPSDGASMADLVIDLGITDDVLIEGPEDYSLVLANAATSSGANVTIDPAADDVITTINDTQGPGGAADGPAEWSITGATSVDEGASAQYTVSLSGQFGAGEVVTVDLGLTDIDTNSSDYASITAAIAAAAAANPDVTFNAATGTLTYTAPSDGASMADLVIDLGITDDVLIEGPEDFSLGLTNATTSSGANVAIDATSADVVTTINDTQGPGGAADGPAEWSITGQTSVDEGGTAQYTVALSGQFGAGEVVTVDLGLTDIDTTSSDYASITAAIVAAAGANPDVTFNATTGTLTYAAPADGASMTDLVLDLGIVDDVLLEGPEDYTLSLTSPATSTGAAVGIDTTADDVTTTINDTQGPGGPVEGPATWSITGTPEVGEGNNATYTVLLDGVFQGGEVVTVSLGLSDNSTNSADYGNLFTEIAAAAASDPNLAFDIVTGTLSYTAPADGASMAPLVFNLPITDDTNVEPAEDYDIVLSNSTSPTGVANTIDPTAASANTIINGDPFVTDDIQHTTVGTPVSDNVLTNDVDPDGDPLTVTTTPVIAPTNGTLVLAANGTYTYTPNPGFRGVDTFDYEVCDDFGNCEVGSVTIMIADLSASKSQGSVTPNGDNFDVEFTLTVENTGSTRMDNLTLFDDIATQFGSTFLSVASPILDASGVVGGVAPTLNAAWSANTALDLLDPAATNEFLMPGDSFNITFVATIDPDATGASTPLSNLATIAGEDITTIPGSPLPVIDDSDAGSDPATTNPGTPGDSGGEDDPTPLFIPDIRVVKQQVGTPVELSDRSWNVDFELFVENTGTTDLTSVSLRDDAIAQLGSVWQGSSNLAIDAAGLTLGGVSPGLNTGWLSDPSQDIFDGTGVLNPGESIRVTFTLNLDPDNTPSGLAGPITNQAIATGTANDGSGAVVASDDSDSGADPNTTNSSAAGDTGSSDDPTPIEISEIGAAKRIVSSVPIPTSPGHVAMTYELRVRNLATIELTNITLEDDLATNLGPAFQGILGLPTFISSTATSNPTLNSGFNGSSDINLFDGSTGILRAGEEFVIQFELDVQVDLLNASSENHAVAAADDGGASVSDISDTGSDPAGSNPNTTGDTGGEDDPTLPPALGVAKDHGTPVAVGQEWLVPVEIFVRNLGARDLGNLVVIDDVMSSFGAAFVSASSPVIDVSGVVGGIAPNSNPTWVSDSGLSLLDGSGLLAPNDAFTISFDVIVDPDATGTSQYLVNQVVVTASDPTDLGLRVIDTSDSGSNPSGSNPGEPGDSGLTEDPTPLEIPDIGLAKDVTLVRQAGASFVLSVSLTLENIGTVDIASLSLNDDVSIEFAPHTVSVVSAPRFVTSSATLDPNFNPGFLSDTSQDIFDMSSGLLAPGEDFVVEFEVQIGPDFSALVDGELVLTNQATGGGAGIGSTGATLSVVSDASDSGSNPNSNNGVGGFSDATPITISVFAFDSLNNFSNPFESAALTVGSIVPRPMLNTTYTGTAQPGSSLNLNIYDQTGLGVGSRTVVADAAGNWLALFPNATVHTRDQHYGTRFYGFGSDGTSTLGLDRFGESGRAFHNASSWNDSSFGARSLTSRTFGHHLYHMPGTEIDGQPHRMEVGHTFARNAGTFGSAPYGLAERHFQPAVHPTVYFFSNTISGDEVAGSSSSSLRAAHLQNTRPVQLGSGVSKTESRTRTVSW